MCPPGNAMLSRYRDFPEREGHERYPLDEARLRGNLCKLGSSLRWLHSALLSDTHTTSTPRSQSFDFGQLAHEPVATFGLVAPAGLQGFSATLLYALSAALSEASPPFRGIPDHETVNMLNGQALAAEYADLIMGFARSGILERERLQRIGSALGSRYVLLPGLAEFNQVIIDRISIYGWNFIQSRVTTLRVWLQLWDTRMARSSGSRLGRSPWQPGC
jgi:hypothetical protein